MYIKRIIFTLLLIAASNAFGVVPFKPYNYIGIVVVPVDTPACRASFKKNLLDYKSDATYPFSMVYESYPIKGKVIQSATLKGIKPYPQNWQDKLSYAEYRLLNNITSKTDNYTELNVKQILKPLTLSLTGKQYYAALKAKIIREIDKRIPCVKYSMPAGYGTLDMDPISESLNINMDMVFVEGLYPMPVGNGVAIIDNQKTDATYAPHNAKMMAPVSHVKDAKGAIVPSVDISIPKTHMDGMYHIVAQNSGSNKILPIYAIKTIFSMTGIKIEIKVPSIVSAVNTSVTAGIRVISNSWHNTFGNHPIITAKFAEAYSKGILIVQSAGNNGVLNNERVVDPNVIIVGMLYPDGQLQSDYGNYQGKKWPHLVIKSNFDTTYPISHQSDYGTAPMVGNGSPGATAFMAALIARFPKEKTPDQIKKCLFDTADKVELTGINPVVHGEYIAHGIVNPAKALKACEVVQTPTITYVVAEIGYDVGWTVLDPANYITIRQQSCAAAGGDAKLIPWIENNTIGYNCFSKNTDTPIATHQYALIPSDKTMPIIWSLTRPVTNWPNTNNPPPIW